MGNNHSPLEEKSSIDSFLCLSLVTNGALDFYNGSNFIQHAKNGFPVRNFLPFEYKFLAKWFTRLFFFFHEDVHLALFIQPNY